MMKTISFLLICFMIFYSSCRTTKPSAGSNPGGIQTSPPVKDVASPAVDFSEQTTWLLGYFSKARLMNEPYSSWYDKGYNDYQVSSESVNTLNGISKNGITIKIVMGTWCPDSRREVPRFMKILDLWQFPIANVTFIGVDNAKRSPVGEYEMLDIQRVPTFIIYKNNIEAGRIIENPSTSLEQDIINILKK